MTYNNLDSSFVLDCSGLLCPAPILLTEERLSGARRGTILKVLVTDPGALPDLKAWCKMSGETYLEEKRFGDVYEIRIQKTA